MLNGNNLKPVVEEGDLATAREEVEIEGLEGEFQHLIIWRASKIDIPAQDLLKSGQSTSATLQKEVD
jgi:hypothetical protein